MTLKPQPGIIKCQCPLRAWSLTSTSIYIPSTSPETEHSYPDGYTPSCLSCKPPRQPTHFKTFLPLLAPGLPLHTHSVSCRSPAILLHSNVLPTAYPATSDHLWPEQTMNFSAIQWTEPHLLQWHLNPFQICPPWVLSQSPTILYTVSLLSYS